VIRGQNVQDSRWDEVGVRTTDDFEDRVVEVGIVGTDVCGLDAGDGGESVRALLDRCCVGGTRLGVDWIGSDAGRLGVSAGRVLASVDRDPFWESNDTADGTAV